MIFASFKNNYGDEFDIFGFSLYKTREEFILELYKTWLFAYLESGECLKVEEYLKANNLDIDDYLEKVTVIELESLIKDADKYYKNNENEFYFGTNEAISYESFKDFSDCFEVKEITPEEYKTIRKIIGETYGVFPISY